MNAQREEIEATLYAMSMFYGADFFTARNSDGKISDECIYRMNCYLEELSALTPEQLRDAVARIKKTWKPTTANRFPAIYEFLSAVGQSPDDGAALAVAALRTAIRKYGSYSSVSFGDPALHYVVSAYGSWLEICMWEQKQWDVNEGRMREAYREAERAKINGGNHLAGIYELADNGMGKVVCIDWKQNRKIKEIPFQRELGAEAMAELDALCYKGNNAPVLRVAKEFMPELKLLEVV